MFWEGAAKHIGKSFILVKSKYSLAIFFVTGEGEDSPDSKSIGEGERRGGYQGPN